MRGEDKSLEKGIIGGTLLGNRKGGKLKTAWIRAGKNLGFFEKVFRFLLGF